MGNICTTPAARFQALSGIQKTTKLDETLGKTNAQ
jgi:hypothetical protein